MDSYLDMGNRLPAPSRKLIDSPTKSDSDRYSYRVITLENGLTALLISKCNNSSTNNMLLKTGMVHVSLSINVGAYSDPEEFQGLAHLLEHMVNMGSKKYPGVNDFDKYLEKSIGWYNAFTENECTTFHFSSGTNYLEGSLNRFAQFFISPLLTKDAIEKELEAVDSEFNQIKNEDEERVLSLILSLGMSGHPATYFYCGNRNSLIENKTYEVLAKELDKFRLRHYCANRMKLAIRAGNLTLDNLEKLIRDNFEEVHNNFLSPINFSEYKNGFNTEKFKKMYYVKPIENLCQVRITWMIPSEAKLYRYKASDYICRILEYEGPGSLFSFLKKRMWALSVELVNEEESKANSVCFMFAIKISLTHQGMHRLNCVLDAVFSFLSLLKQNGPCERLFNEFKHIEDTRFKYKYEYPDIDKISTTMMNCEMRDYLTGPLLYLEYNEEVIRNLIDSLNPETCNIVIQDYRIDSCKYTKTEKWFGTEYTCEAIPEKWKIQWKQIKPYKEFSYPSSNKFFSNFNVLVLETNKNRKYPEKIYSNKKCELWYNNYTRGNSETELFYLFKTSVHLTSARYYAMLNLYVEILNYSLKEELSSAEDAFLYYLFQVSVRGLELKVNGFNDKLPLLVESITEMLIKCIETFSLELFETIKVQVFESYHNCIISPLHLLEELQNSVLLGGYWNLIDRRKVLLDISLSELQVFVNEFYASATIQNLVEGNISEEKSINLLTSLINNTIISDKNIHSQSEIKVFQLSKGEQRLSISNLNVNDNNSIIRIYYQIGPSNTSDYCILELIISMMLNPLFHQLRNMEKLGYAVLCAMNDDFEMLGFNIMVQFQENKFSSSYVNERMEIFLESFKCKIMENEDEWFRGFIECLIKRKKNCSYSSARNQKEIYNRKYKFDRLQEEIIFLKSVTSSDVRSWCLRNLNPEVCKKFTIQIVGHNLDVTSSSVQ